MPCSYLREPEVGRRAVIAYDHGPQIPIKDREGAGLAKGGILEPGDEGEKGKGLQGGEVAVNHDVEWCALNFLSSAAFLPCVFVERTIWERKGIVARPEGQCS